MTAAVAPTPGALVGVGEVRHARLRPAHNAFNYRTFFLWLPMRTLRRDPSRLLGLARNRAGLVSFHDRDHGEGGPDALAWIEATLARAGIHDADGEIWLHTYPRVLGYVFKPVSFWYCHRADGRLRAVLAEVNNTFGERHGYLLDDPATAWGREMTATKVFHVSPFCQVDGRYRFRFMRVDAPGSVTPVRTVARIDYDDDGGPLLRTSVSGQLQPATSAALRHAFWSMPGMTLGVIARIHWQALRLWRKRVPFFRKPAPPDAFLSR